ncbi:MAG: RNA methyltransferase [Oscillospiraceae bacterium]
MEQITSKDNKFIKEYTKLSTSKSERKQQQKFVVEGKKLIDEAFSSGIKIEMVFVTEAFIQKSELKKNTPFLEKLFQNTTCFLISTAIENKIAMTKTPEGIFAICDIMENNLTLENIKKNGHYIMLVDLQDNGNVGTIIRAAEAIGIDGVILTSCTCDIFSQKLIRASMGSSFRVKTLIVQDELLFLKQLAENGVKTYASVIDSDANNIKEVSFSNPSVLLIGNEGNGISKQISQSCDEKVTIKMQGKTESLNAAMASCILMWEMIGDK